MIKNIEELALKKIFEEWFSWFGVVIGALSLISAVNHMFSIGLYGFFGELIEFYRNASRPLVDFIAVFHLNITRFQLDILLIYFVLVMMSFRAGFFPLMRPEIFEDHRRRSAGISEEIGNFDIDEPAPDNLITAEQLSNGTYRMRFYVFRPNWHLYGLSFISSVFLVPLLTLLPFRRAIPRRTPGGVPPLKLLRIAFTLSDAAKRRGMIEIGEGTAYSVSYLLTLRSYAVVAVQAAALPAAVVLFFVLAKYGPIR